MIYEVAVTVLIVAALAAGTALLLDRASPDRTAYYLATKTVLSLIIVFSVLMILFVVTALRAPCPDDGVCDAGAMAAVGAIMVGIVTVIITILVGGPLAYATIAFRRRR